MHEPICPFLSIFDWYFLIRKDAEQLLRCDGDFLVRESQQPGQFVLTGMQVTAASDWLIPDNTGLWLASADNTDILLVHRAAGRSIYFLWIPRGWSGEKLCTSPNVLYIIFAGLMKFLLNSFSLLIIVCRTRDRTFESVTHLIDYHRNNKLPIISAESALRLDTPVVRRRWGVLSTQHVILCAFEMCFSYLRSL